MSVISSIEIAFSWVSCPDRQRTLRVRGSRNEWNSAMFLLGSPTGRTNPPITLAPLRQDQCCLLHPCTYFATGSAPAVQHLEGFCHFHLARQRHPARESCLRLMNFDSLQLSRPFPPGQRAFSLAETVCQDLERLAWLTLCWDLTSSSCWKSLLTCNNVGWIILPFHRSGEGLYHFSPPRFNYHYRWHHTFTCSC